MTSAAATASRARSRRGGAARPGGPTRAQRPPRRRLMLVLLLAVTLVGLVFIGVYPTRTWLSQRGQLRDAQHQLDVLHAQDDALSSQIATLDTDAEIERLAREKYNLVLPGEESYAINPAPPPPIAVPGVWPFTGLAAAVAPPP